MRRVAGSAAPEPGARSGLPGPKDAITPFLAFRRCESAEPPALPVGDAALWWAVLHPDRPVTLSRAADPAPLFPQGDEPLEVWTECELSALHALCRLADIRRDEELRSRALSAAAWHLEETQPDNATNRPWAIPVFLALESQRTDGAASFYAQTLLHNCMTGPAGVEPLSAEILRDGADILDPPA